MPDQPVLLWFRRDLRLADNPAVHAAVGSGRPVVPVYVLDERDSHCWDAGGASRWWLHHSIESLDRDLQSLGGRLTLRRGETAEVLEKLADETGAGHLVFSRFGGPESDLLEKTVSDRLGHRLELEPCSGYLLNEPGTVRTASGDQYRIFTPFFKACLQLPDPAAPLDKPGKMRFGTPVMSDELADWSLTPGNPDWATGFRDVWTPGEKPAAIRSRELLSGRLDRYAKERDRPDHDGTSRLSPHLHFGEVSPRQLWHGVRQGDNPFGDGAQGFIRQLYWREFSCHLLHAFPDLPTSPLRKEFEQFSWQRRPDLLAAWQNGETGYPIIDAGMRELWQTGWMHNRVRMLVASFLVKHLLIPWQEGAAWFRDTLVDADEANNSASWQWVAGCGTDAAPYFRIFNPVIQGRKFDPHGRYTKRWIPELAKLDAGVVHAPWEASQDALREAGVRLGATYPAPIVEHREARERALAAYRRVTGDGRSASGRPPA